MQLERNEALPSRFLNFGAYCKTMRSSFDLTWASVVTQLVGLSRLGPTGVLTIKRTQVDPMESSATNCVVEGAHMMSKENCIVFRYDPKFRSWEGRLDFASIPLSPSAFIGRRPECRQEHPLLR